MQQEYSGLATTVFYDDGCKSRVALLVTFLGNVSGVLPRLASKMFEIQSTQPGAIRPEMLPGFDPRLFTPGLMAIASHTLR